MNLDDVPKTVLVASGKGGVGKTTVASDLAMAASEMGYSVGLIDADISTPNTFEVIGGEEADVGDQRLSTHNSITPPKVNGVQLMSMGIMLDEDIPLLRDGAWRAQTVADYITHADWEEGTDMVVIDTPPGTGEELQVIASEAPPTHAFVVTTPHPSSIRDAKKTHDFFGQADVEHQAIMNMAYIPNEDMADHVLDRVDFTEVEQVGDARAEQIAELIREKTPRRPLFGYEPGQSVPFDVNHAATIPYTEDFDRRRPMYEDAVEAMFEAQEVKA